MSACGNPDNTLTLISMSSTEVSNNPFSGQQKIVLIFFENDLDEQCQVSIPHHLFEEKKQSISNSMKDI